MRGCRGTIAPPSIVPSVCLRMLLSKWHCRQNHCLFSSQNMVFIAVHIGAGYHSALKRDKYLKICTKACEAAMVLLKAGQSATVAVAEAIKCLENDVLTNAGFGSNLNIGGNVECDASLMDGHDLLFGSVGAIHSIKNPIEAARLLLENQRVPSPLGLIAPSFLAGEGATKWAIARGCEQSNLKSDKSSQVYDKYKRKLDEHCENESTSSPPMKYTRYDTVGAISLDAQQRVAAGVSSGGLILKQEGRVGQASVIGAGCWAQDGVSISTSGIGEYIIRTSLARECAKELLSENSSLPGVTKMFKEQFFESPLMRNVSSDDHLAGILALIHDDTCGSTELVWAHSTATMCIGYMNDTSQSATAFISQMPTSAKPGTTVMAQSRLFKHKRDTPVN